MRGMSEPYCLVQLMFVYNRGLITWNQYQELIRDFVKVMFKVEPESGVEYITAKTGKYTQTQMPIIRKHFPSMPIVMSTR